MRSLALFLILIVSSTSGQAVVTEHWCKDHNSTSDPNALHTCYSNHTDGSGDEDACHNDEDVCNGASGCAAGWDLRECTAAEDAGFPGNYGFACYRASQVCGDGDEIECFGIGGSFSSDNNITCMHYRCDPELLSCTDAFPPEMRTYSCFTRPPGQ